MSDNAKPNLLLTGASGFLGSEIVRICDAEGRGVRTVSRSKLERDDHHCVDLSAGELPISLFEGIETVIHAAGLAHQFGKVADEETAFTAANATAVKILITAAVKAGVQHFVYVSSSGVYGPAADMKTESDTCDPTGHYATSKMLGEQFATEVASETGIKLTILRMTTLYGEGDRGNINRLISAIERKRFPNIGSGENKKSLIHKRDAARACLMAASRMPQTDAEVYNVANDPIAMRTVVARICESLGCNVPFQIPASFATGSAGIASAASLGKGPFGRIKTTIGKWLNNDTFSGEKFANEFGYAPSISFAEGIDGQVKSQRTANAPQVSNPIIKRAFDLVAALTLFAIFAIPMAIIAVVIKLTSPGPVLYWADRVGKDNKNFAMPKFRSMRTDTPEVATHLLSDAQNWITPIGRFIRKTSLDEVPQLIPVITGKMSFVGPRPALHNQYDLNELRTYFGVHQLKPGMTGLAVIRGRDELYTEEKVEFDRQYLLKQSFGFDFKILLETFFKVIKRDGVKDNDKEIEQPFLETRAGEKTVVLATTDLLNAAVDVYDRSDNDYRIVSIRRSALSNVENVRDAVGDANHVLMILRESDLKSDKFSISAISESLGDRLTTIPVPDREQPHSAVAEDGRWIKNFVAQSTTNNDEASAKCIC